MGGGCNGGLARLGNAHPHLREAVDEGREDPLRLAQNLDRPASPQNVLPQKLQLHLCEVFSHAAVDAEAEGEVLTRAGTVDEETVGFLDCVFVAIAGDVPHGDLLALAYGFAADFRVLERGAAHVGDRRLVADDFRDHGVDQFGPEPFTSPRMALSFRARLRLPLRGEFSFACAHLDG